MDDEIQQMVQDKVLSLRDTQVLIDSDVALLYGVQTKRINEAVKNNPQKFPDGYILRLTDAEWKLLKPKITTSSKGGKTKTPYAFTERGLYMLATILKGDKATSTTLAIIDTFTGIRELSRNLHQLSTHPSDDDTSIIEKSNQIINNIIGDDLYTAETESQIEVNLAVIKFKHIIKRKEK